LILVLSRDDDRTARDVVARLADRGAEHFWFDPVHFPAEAEVRLGFDQGTTLRQLCFGGRVMNIADVRAVWNRRPQAPRAAPEVADPEHRHWISRASAECLAGLWETPECRWVPARPHVDRAAQNKGLQLALAQRLGFRVPRTLITNRPRDLLDFYAECEGRMVAKSLWPDDIRRGGEPYRLYTVALRRRDMADFRALQRAPMILQAYIAKRFELRITVIGTSVFAAEIHSQERSVLRDDWRHLAQCAVHRPHELPEAVRVRCLDLVEALGLCFGAIDMIVTPQGEYIFLEINSNGEFGWIEPATGLPITEAMAELLIHGRR
jgi:hypothetical protein